MNFPESSSVKKREALSNIIFKITQSTEKENKQNERLLRLNLSYQLKMLRLAKQKEKLTWDKLNCEKLLRSHTNDWIFEGEKLDIKKEREAVEYRSESLPRLEIVNQGMDFASEMNRHVGSSIRRVYTAPLNNKRGKPVKHERKAKSAADMQSENGSTSENRDDQLKHANLLPKIESKQKKVPLVEEHIGLAKGKRETRRENGRTVDLREGNSKRREMKGAHGCARGLRAKGLRDTMPKVEKQNALIQSRNIEEGRLESTETSVENYAKLLERAEKSTEMLSAYIPTDSGYRRTCATRKIYKDKETARPRILTRYFRERKTYEHLVRCSKKSQSTAPINSEYNNQLKTLSYI